MNERVSLFADWALKRFRSGCRSVIIFFETRMDALLGGWVFAVIAIGAAKVARAPVAATGPIEAMAMMVPFLLIAVAPVAGYYLSAAAFPRGLLSAQPSLRLSRYGKWRELDVDTAQRNSAFGPVGLMASLISGILINLPVRCLGYITAVPAMSSGVPEWAHSIAYAMTADVVVMNFFYMVCFVMALRAVPLFPRMLIFAWMIDILMQLVIARRVGLAPDLPRTVALSLSHVLRDNVEKVMLSAFVWLPYLILSERVNVTFRRRIRV